METVFKSRTRLSKNSRKLHTMRVNEASKIHRGSIQLEQLHDEVMNQNRERRAGFKSAVTATMAVQAAARRSRGGASFSAGVAKALGEKKPSPTNKDDAKSEAESAVSAFMMVTAKATTSAKVVTEQAVPSAAPPAEPPAGPPAGPPTRDTPLDIEEIP